MNFVDINNPFATSKGWMHRAGASKGRTLPEGVLFISRALCLSPSSVWWSELALPFLILRLCYGLNLVALSLTHAGVRSPLWHAERIETLSDYGARSWCFERSVLIWKCIYRTGQQVEPLQLNTGGFVRTKSYPEKPKWTVTRKTGLDGLEN